MQNRMPLAVDPPSHGAGQWTPRVVIKRHVRWSPNTSSRPQYAALTLRVEPYSGPEPAVFVNEVPPDDEILKLYREPEEKQFVQSCIAGVVEGIEEELRASAEEGFSITGVFIALTELSIHPVDSNSNTCRIAARMALRECLKRENIVEHTAS